ncbi:holo-[acyl-carrier-protein] synthase [Desulfovibrio sulfodismutans]|uniref:Holo-[acyl-carrier-protein] synthase n=1 Tax=Desulfolutivibrio sulfodismutans TaxID=63561 RepID=A0A7K3NG33_9BACT|nr:holo-[acyl-carrier-protein] synthase [Desulfolutivibrio sulfodismutans]QLA12118.1 holo-[acyl-carrier-protein] synthase [Desulfolutivibrio sulfodismutans DSM 3696]
MIVGLGLDVVELSRIAKAHERFGEAFAKRILTADEMAARTGRDPVLTLAGCFSAKEAAVKALGTGFADGITFQCLEVLPDPLGRPVLRLFGPAAARARQIGATAFHVSLTHDRGMAAAVVVAEGPPPAPRMAQVASPCSGCAGAPGGPDLLSPLPSCGPDADPGLWRGPGERIFPDPAAKRRHPGRRPRGRSS